MRTSRWTVAGTVILALLESTSIGVAAQDEAQSMTIAELGGDAFPVSGTVTIDGVALQPKFAPWDEQYFFSDGTGVIVIDPNSAVPLLTPISIVGHQVERDELVVTRWVELDRPMGSSGPREAAFLAWVALLADDPVGDDDDGDDA